MNSALAELRNVYLQSLPEKLEALTRAVEQTDYGMFVRLGHQLKGSGRSYGFAEVSEIGARIEQVGVDRRQALLEPTLIEFRELIRKLLTHVAPTEKL
ncbi:Hpt domain-containing protein [bacterium]|nr:Hpt domain-containing protein [bacterium]MBU1984566.1 Hpt domain-containing protein [bacterium]